MGILYIRYNDREMLMLYYKWNLDLEEIRKHTAISVKLGTYLSITDDLWNRNFLDEALFNRQDSEKIINNIANYFRLEKVISAYPADYQRIIVEYITIISKLIGKQDLSDEWIKNEIDTVFSIGAFLDSCCPSSINLEQYDIPDDFQEFLEETKKSILNVDCSLQTLYTFLGLIHKEALICSELIDLPKHDKRHTFDSANEVYKSVSENLIEDTDIYYCYEINSISDLLVASLLEIFKSNHIIKKCGCCDQYFVPLGRTKQVYCHNEVKRYFYPLEGVNKKGKHYYCDEWIKKIGEKKGNKRDKYQVERINKLYDLIRRRLIQRNNSNSNNNKVTYSYDNFIEEACQNRIKIREGKSTWDEYIRFLEEIEKKTKKNW